MYNTTIINNFENVILGTAGNTFTVPTGSFRIIDDSVSSLSRMPVNAIEHCVEVVIGNGSEEYPVNPYDGFGLYRHPVSVKIGYQLTNDGDEDSEQLTPQSGAGTIKAIRARWSTDQHALRQALEWNCNPPAEDPFVISLTSSDAPSFDIDEPGQKVIGTINFSMVVRVLLNTNYA